ncbi:transporter [Sinomicrobium soli]|uniref:transporter n=1 Tax=Sinomicrobium sp. N-1-3-6 TaxID=2219864 RepID=UPI000DCB34F2|nr:transporter [Sinomicrobium sp. N-1-3-6]RAV27828.1 transporter [Sinomicrobium sp. N-1-3-6]
MKNIHIKHIFTMISLCTGFAANAQYTDIINSDRPGKSMSAYAPGKGVYQAEIGGFYERREHSGLRTENSQFGTDFAIRLGMLEERLELSWRGIYLWDQLTQNTSNGSYSINQSNFYENTIGAKYLLFEPEIREPNLYSWRADHTAFNIRDLIPAISVYLGTNLFIGDNPFFPEESGSISVKAGVITQSHFAGRWVLTTNFFYDRLGGSDEMFNYIFTLTHSLYDGRYSVFAEHQGYKSSVYSDGIFRLGAARLINSNLQVDLSAGINIKDTPSRLFGGVGVSYRLDYHKDELIPGPVEENDRNGSLDSEKKTELIDHKAGKKKKYASKKKKEDKRKQKKARKKRKKSNPFDDNN